MNKHEVIKALIAALEEHLNVLQKSAKAAHDAATHPDAVAKSKYETQGVEASYLAGAQAKRALEVEELIGIYRTLPLMDFSEIPINTGALVELDQEGKSALYFLAPKGGGIQVTVGNREVRTLTPESPLGAAMVGLSKGEDFEFKSGDRTRDFEVTAVW